LVVLGKALRDSLEGVGERFEARTVGTVGEAVVVRRDCLDEETLALGLRAERATALDRFLRPLRFRRSRAGSKGVADEDGRDAPGGDGAMRVALEHLAKRLLTLLPPERVQQGDGAFE